MSNWDLEELGKLCSQRGIPAPTIYQTSLQWRFWRASFHAERAQEVWKELFSQTFTLGDETFNRAAFSFEADVEACVQALHSMADILAQIINAVILGGHFQEHQVSLWRVTERLEKTGIASQVAGQARKLLGSYEFSYLDAFCNTIKHRRLVFTEFRAEYGGNYRNEAGLLFRAFNYKVASYPETWGKDILEDYRHQLFEHVNNVGLSINDFLR